jgi:hypothetical protein
MTSITLPPDLEQAIELHARRQGTTSELLIVEKLREQFLMLPEAGAETTGQSMADFFAGYVGGLHSSEFVPGGAQLSQDSGRKFTDLLLLKHNRNNP